MTTCDALFLSRLGKETGSKTIFGGRHGGQYCHGGQFDFREDFTVERKSLCTRLQDLKKIHYSLNMFSKKKDPKGKPKIVKISLSFSNDDFIIRPINNSTIV